MSNNYKIIYDGRDLYLEGGILESKYYIGSYPMDDEELILARKRLKLLLEHPLFDNTLEGYEIERLIDTQKHNMNKKYGRSFSMNMNKYNFDKYVIRVAYGPEMLFVVDAYSDDNRVITHYTISSVNAQDFTKGIKEYMERHGLRIMKVKSVYNLEAYYSGDPGISIKRNDGGLSHFTITRNPPTRKPDENKEEKPSENTVKPLTDEEITVIRDIIAERNTKADDVDKMVQEYKEDYKPHITSDMLADLTVQEDREESVHTPEANTVPAKTDDLRNGEIVIIKADKSKLPHQFNYLAKWYYFESDVDTWMKVPDAYKTLAKYNELGEEFVTVFGDCVDSKDIISVSKVEPEWFGN